MSSQNLTWKSEELKAAQDRLAAAKLKPDYKPAFTTDGPPKPYTAIVYDKKPLPMKRILALDVATHCGWKTATASGVWNLTPKRDESAGMRLIRFKAKLSEICELEKINMVVFERSAGFHMNAVIVQSEIHGVLKLFLEENRINYNAYSATEIKKFATGKGNANKEAMVKAAKEKYGYTGFDDNEADAIHIYYKAMDDFKFIK